jgi:glutamate racemase
VATGAAHIGIIGTTRTIASGTFRMEIEKIGSARVSGQAAPLLAPIVEEGWANTDIARLAVKEYVSMFDNIDTLVLACTHYPLLLPAFREAVRGDVVLLDPSKHVATRLVDWIRRHPGYTQPGSGHLACYCTGDPALFRTHGEPFLGGALPHIRLVEEQDGRLARRDRMRIIEGQIVR